MEGSAVGYVCDSEAFCLNENFNVGTFIVIALFTPVRRQVLSVQAVGRIELHSVRHDNTSTTSTLQSKQGVALTGHNTTGPTCSVCHLTAYVTGRRRSDRPRAWRPARPPDGSVADDNGRRR